MPTGRVKWFNAFRGYGFIAQADGNEVYVPRSAIKGGDQALKKGQRVRFDIVQGPDGAEAANVVKIHLLF